MNWQEPDDNEIPPWEPEEDDYPDENLHVFFVGGIYLVGEHGQLDEFIEDADIAATLREILEERERMWRQGMNPE